MSGTARRLAICAFTFEVFAYVVGASDAYVAGFFVTANLWLAADYVASRVQSGGTSS